MKLQHPSYANQKLQTEWGLLEVDADGIIEVKADQAEFFQKVLKFQQIESDSKPSKKAEKAADIAPPKVEVKKEEEPPPPEQVEEVSPETEEIKEETKEEEHHEKKGKGSRFAGKKGGK